MIDAAIAFNRVGQAANREKLAPAGMSVDASARSFAWINPTIWFRSAAAVRTVSPFESVGKPTAATAPSVPKPRIEVHNVPENEAIDIPRDPQVAAVAKPMPTALIKPLGVAGAAATGAWGIAACQGRFVQLTGDGVVAAVLDTGIDKSHPAFAGVTIVEQDFSGSGNGDRQGHGTHCAGTIFGRDVSETRIGIARGVKKALIGKVLADHGGGGSEMIFRGIQSGTRSRR
jgi:subtilisin family serine protease